MRDSMREQGAGALDASVKRLERALGALETRFDRRLKRIEAMDAARSGDGQSERARLIAELETVRARERALEAIAAEASAALGRAAEEVRAALADPVMDDEERSDGIEPAPAADVDVAAETTPYVEPAGLEGDAVFLPQAAKG